MVWWGGERKISLSVQRTRYSAQRCIVRAKYQCCRKGRERKLLFSESISIDGDNYKCHIPNFFFREFSSLINSF